MNPQSRSTHKTDFSVQTIGATHKYMLYDYLQIPGGAERLALDFISGFPDFELVVSRTFPDALSLEQLGEINVRNLGSAATRPLGRISEAILSFVYFTRFLENAEIVIYSGFYAPFAVSKQKHGRRLYYCHTPPRFAYDWRDRYLDKVPKIIRPFAAAAINLLRQRYETSLAQMDEIIANSENVRRRLKRFLNVDAVVIHPPIDTERFKWIDQGDYFLSLARLVPYKRVDLIVKAFCAMPDQKLVVASGGTQEAYLRELAKGASNIFFTGWKSDRELREIIGKARATIYLPHDEDFGMSPVESMSAGKPVIGVAEGGLLETVVHDQTGKLIDPMPAPEAIADAVNWFTPERAIGMRQNCEARAALFSKNVFFDRMRDILEKRG